MNYTSYKGLMTELKCQEDFTSWGILLSQPIINDSRYDFLADIEGKIYKIQCKTSSPVDEVESAISFSVSSKNWNNGEYKDYHGQIDYFYTCFNEQGYLVPIDKVGRRQKVLRFYTESSNAGNDKITWASDFEFEKIIRTLIKDDRNKDSIVKKERNRDTGKVKQNKDTAKEKKNKGNVQTIKNKPKNFCVDCGKEISSKATRCKSCVGKMIGNRKVVERPAREELKNMIRSMSFLEIGSRYNVTDNAVRKWCDGYNLPRRKRDINNYSDEEWSKI